MNKRIRINGNLYEAASPRRRMNEAEVAREEPIKVISGWSAKVFDDIYGDAFNRNLGVSIYVKLDGEPEDFITIGGGSPEPAPYICYISSLDHDTTGQIQVNFDSADSIEDITSKVVGRLDKELTYLSNTMENNPLIVIDKRRIDDVRRVLLNSIEHAFKRSFSNVSKANITY